MRDSSFSLGLRVPRLLVSSRRYSPPRASRFGWRPACFRTGAVHLAHGQGIVFGRAKPEQTIAQAAGHHGHHAQPGASSFGTSTHGTSMAVSCDGRVTAWDPAGVAILPTRANRWAKPSTPRALSPCPPAELPFFWFVGSLSLCEFPRLCSLPRCRASRETEASRQISSPTLNPPLSIRINTRAGF